MKRKTPLYLSIYEEIRKEITEGVYAYGSKLPSRRSYAERSGVSTVTVCHAYELLCDEGYVQARERSGYYVIFRSDDMFPVSEAYFPERFQHSVKKDRFPFSVLARTMRRVLSECGEDILIKTPNKGSLKLREAIAAYLRRSRGIHTEAENIIIGSGAEYLYGMLLRVLGKDKKYAIESPSYIKISQIYGAEGVTFETLPLGVFGIESDALRNTPAEVLHITPFRSYPSGITATASKRNEYLHWAEERDGFIIEDDFYSEFSTMKKPEETLFAAAGKENVIYLNTFTLTVSPALRIGYAVLPKRLVRLYEEKCGFYSCPVPTFEQYVLTELIESGDFERHLNRERRRRRRMTEK